jgi:hypothetical protein
LPFESNTTRLSLVTNHASKPGIDFGKGWAIILVYNITKDNTVKNLIYYGSISAILNVLIKHDLFARVNNRIPAIIIYIIFSFSAFISNLGMLNTFTFLSKTWFSINGKIIHKQDMISINQQHKLTGVKVSYIDCPKNTKKFNKGMPDSIVLHYTAGSSGISSANYLAKPDVKASAHIVIDKSGHVTSLLLSIQLLGMPGRANIMAEKIIMIFLLV